MEVSSRAGAGGYTRGMSHSAASFDTTVAGIAAKIDQGSRIGRDEARWLWENASDAELRSLADVVRGRFHAPGSCTYMVMRIINYTNVCVAQCDYCAFYKLPTQDGGYVLSHDEVFSKLDELLALGGDLAAFNGGFNPHLPLSYYCDLFAAIRARYGDALEFYALTIAEFMYLADHAKLSYADTAARCCAGICEWRMGSTRRHIACAGSCQLIIRSPRRPIQNGVRQWRRRSVLVEERGTSPYRHRLPK